MANHTLAELHPGHALNVERYTIKGAPHECWQWLGPHDRYGYAKSRAGATITGAHRAAYLLRFQSIPEGLVLDHLCENRWCVNPGHLEPVTNTENLRRQRRSGLCRSGQHEMTEENTRVRGPEGQWRSCRACDRVSQKRGQKKYRARLKAERMQLIK